MANNTKSRPGIPMTEDAVKEWEKTFTDMNESIEELYIQDEKKNPNAKYMRLKQQDFPNLL